MRRSHVELDGASVLAYGHWGRPLLAFPAEAGRAWDWENHGMVDAVADLLEAGRIKLYCVDSADNWSWSDRSVPTEERARRHQHYEGWIMGTVLPWIEADCSAAGQDLEVMVAGPSMGAYHAANLALRHAHRVPVALCLSGNYDPTTWHGWGELGAATYFNNPMAYVAPLEGGHLDWLRRQVTLVLVVGQGAWEVEPTGALPATCAFAERLASKGIRHDLDVWGEDSPHDWPSWQRQLRHHLGRFC